MSSFKKQSEKPVAAKKQAEKQAVRSDSEPSNKPVAYVKCAAKDESGKWEEAIVTGLFIDAGIPNDKLPEGTLQLRGKTLNEFTIPAGAIVKVTLHKAFAALGIKAVVNNDGEVSIEAAE